MRFGSTGVGVFRSPFHFFYCQTYRGGLSIYRKFRVKISTRSAYLFGLRLSGAITFSHCCPLSFCSLPGVYPVGSLSAFRPGVFLLWNRGTSCRKIPPLLAPPLGRRTPPASYAPGKSPNRAIVAILIPHNLARLIGFFEPVPIVPPCGRFGEILHCFNCDFRQYVIRGIVKMRLQRITVDNLGNLFQKFFSFVHRFIDF